MDWTARVWVGRIGALIAELCSMRVRSQSAVFSPDDERVVTASDDKTAGVGRGNRGANRQTLSARGFRLQRGLQPDGARVVTASGDKTARVRKTPPKAPNIVATAWRMLGSNHDTAALSSRCALP
jgi:WD40 repeat protein